MPIHNQWLIPQRVIISQASGVVTLVEFIASSQQVRQMLHSVASQGQAHLYLVVDSNQVKQLPSTLEMVRNSTFLEDPTLASIWVGGLEALPLRFVVKMITRLFTKPTLPYETLTQALAALQGQDPTLPDLLQAYQNLG